MNTFISECLQVDSIKRLKPGVLGALPAAALVIALYGISSVPIQAFIAHDDWPFILGDRHISKWVLAEGRPLIGLWSVISSYIVTPNIAFLGYWFFMSCIAGFYAAICGYKRWSEHFLASLLVLFSSSVVSLSAWPSYHFFGLALLCISIVGVLVINKDHWSWLVLFVFASVVTFLLYPPFSFVLFLSALAASANGSNDSIKLGFIFVLSIAASLLIIFLVNYLIYGVFGVVPQSWRYADGLVGHEGFIKNIIREIDVYGRILVNNPHLTVLIVFGSVYGIITKKFKLLYLATSFLVPIAFDVLLVGKTGAVSPERVFIFFPFLAILLASSFSHVTKNWILGISIFVMAFYGHNLISKQAASKVCFSKLYDEVTHIVRMNNVEKIYILVPEGYSARGVWLRERLKYDGFKVSYCDGNCIFKSLKVGDGHAPDQKNSLEISF